MRETRNRPVATLGGGLPTWYCTVKYFQWAPYITDWEIVSNIQARQAEGNIYYPICQNYSMRKTITNPATHKNKTTNKFIHKNVVTLATTRGKTWYTDGSTLWQGLPPLCMLLAILAKLCHYAKYPVLLEFKVGNIFSWQLARYCF